MLDQSTDSISLINLRENALAILGFIYAIGYGASALYAYKENLGVIAAVDSQYLLAGFLPFIAIVGISKVFKIEKKWLLPFSDFVKKQNKINGWRLILFGLLLITISYKKLIKLDLLAINSSTIIYFLIYYIFVYSLYLLLIAIESIDKDIALTYKEIFYSKESLKSKVNLLWLHSVRLFVFVWAAYRILTVYYSDFLPNIPQELGGVKPKTCIFEVKTEDFLIPRPDKLLSNTYSEDCNIILSDTVLVYYYNDEKFLVKPKKGPAKVYELSRDIVKTITWLGD